MMRLRTRLTLLFTVVQAASAVTIGVSVGFVARAIVEKMVEEESREMVESIADTLEIIGEDGFDTAREFVLKRSIGRTGFYFILDRSGRYIIHPNETVVGVSWVGKQDFIDYIMAHREAPGEQRFIRYVSPKTGQWKQVYFTTVPGSGWTVCSSAWEHEMYAPTNRINLALLVVLVLASAVTTFCSLRESYRLSRIFGDLANALIGAAQGDFTIGVDVDGYSKETEQATQCLNRSISGTMNGMVATVKQLASRSSDISSRLKDDIGRSVSAIAGVNETLEAFAKKMDLLDASTGNTDRSVKELRETAQSLESQAKVQATAAEESSAAVDQINATMASVRSVALKQEAGGTEVIGKLKTYRESLDRLMASINSIRDRVEDIASFNAIINDVAERTHLLAMNAAIEAARAGERGRGFAIVSEEIRGLADSTGRNAVQVGEALQLISSEIRETGEAGDAILSYFRELQEGIRSFVDAFGQITTGTGELEMGAKDIAESSVGIQTGNRRLAESMTHVKQAADQVGEMMERARGIVEDGNVAFREIRSRANVVVTAQDEISILTGWNDRYTGYLAERTARFITDRSEERYRLTDALKSHQNWIHRLQDLIGLDDRGAWKELGDEVVDHTQCEFGRWLASMGENPEVASYDCYREIISVHQALHDELRDLFALVTREERALRDNDIEGLIGISREMVGILDRMDTRLFESELKRNAEFDESCGLGA